MLESTKKDTKRAYNDWVMNFEYGTFTPIRSLDLPFSNVRGRGEGDGTENYKYHKDLADKTDSKTDENYEKVNDIRCKFAFVVIRSKLLCIRESQTLRKENISRVANDIDLCHDELRL